ncbi:primosomal protein N' [soil metagenome]
MAPPTILQIAVPTPLRRCFDYLLPEGYDGAPLQPGMRIKIPWRNKQTIGILMGISHSSSLAIEQLKAATEILDTTPILPPDILDLIRWASQYYHHPIGDVFNNVLPTLLRQGRKPIASKRYIIKASENICIGPPLNTEQQHAIQQVCADLTHFHCYLLHGITGSGKTEVYMGIIEQVLASGKQALVLIPEIGLTPQTLARFQNHFKQPIATLHSGLTDRERLDNWLAATEQRAAIVIGTRSALFTPMPKLGIIIIDEEHDPSFKQQDGWRYSARDLAVLRAQMNAIPIVMGSATPALESQFNALQGRYQTLTLPKRAGAAILPSFQVIDLRAQRLEQGLSAALLRSMRQHLQAQGQVLLFLNRRGFAPVLMCHSCGWFAACQRCDSKLTVHQHSQRLHCHHCDTQRPIMHTCPACAGTQLLPLGLGTERIETALKKHFPDLGIARIDRDSTSKKGSLQQMLGDIHSGATRILIGTQMLAKGHHFPDVTLVAIVDADSGFFCSDFRASERLGQLVMQVAGRAGRADKAGEVIIQTYHPQHPLLVKLLAEGYPSFSNALLAERQLALLPPYSYLALIRAEAADKQQACSFLDKVKIHAQSIASVNLTIMGPIPATIERKAGRYRAQLLLQATQRRGLHEVLEPLLFWIENQKNTRTVRWAIDVDPSSLF